MGDPPVAQAGQFKTGVVTGRGVACVAYEGDNGYTGIVVEIEVNQDTGKVTVKRMWVGIDAGPFRTPTDCAIRPRVVRSRG